jgi:Fic family protein
MELLLLSKRLINHVLYPSQYREKYKRYYIPYQNRYGDKIDPEGYYRHQLDQTLDHIQKLQNILDRNKNAQAIARDAAEEKEILKDNLEKILADVGNINLFKSEILSLKALENKQDRSAIEDDLVVLYQKVAQKYPAKVAYKSYIPSL